MIYAEIKPLLKRMNRFCTRALEAAAGLCVSSGHYEVTPEHLLLKLVEEPSADIQVILRHFEQGSAHLQKSIQHTLEGFRSGNNGRPVLSPQLIEWIQGAWLVGSIDLMLTEIRSGLLLISLLGERSGRYSGADYLTELETVETATLKKKFFEITASSSEAPPDSTETERKGARSSDRGEETALGRFTINFTARARADEIDPVFGRDREIRQMIDILARRRKNNPIVVGEAGVGKTAVVEGMAVKIVAGDVPDLLKGVEILGLDMGLLQAGAGVKGEFENRLKSVIAEVKASPTPIILFIDEAHTLIGAGGSAGMSDAANLLKPALARGELRTIAATTWSEYKKYFEKDAALVRRFQLVSLDEPSPEGAVVILRGLRDKYEAAHHLQILDEAVTAAAIMSSRYISGRQLPDKAVDLLDTAAARVKISMTSRPDILEDAERRIQVLEREQAAYRRDMEGGAAIDKKNLAAVETKIVESQAELQRLEERWSVEKKAADRVIALKEQIRQAGEAREKGESGEAEKKEALQKELFEAKEDLTRIQGNDPLIRLAVDAEVIAKVVSDWTGIPVGKMVHDEAKSVLELDQKLTIRIKGQKDAIETIVQGIRASKAGVGNPETPIGVFLFAGPSGVGKTETALAVADLLFGGERFMATVNMSEFQEKHSVSRLIGSPPGYVGYGEGGVLTEAVRQRPYSIVLLDEVEKADPEVMNLFYQVFDKGVLADGEGRVIDFKNTVIFMTTNLASDILIRSGSDETRPDQEQIIAAIRPVLSRHFKPALLARMTIVPFYPIGQEVMREIVELKLKRLGDRLMANHKMTFAYDPSVVDQIAQRCTEVETGARNIDHILQGTLLPKISTEILSLMGAGALPDRMQLGLDSDGGFCIGFGEEEQSRA